jgi:nicotinate phosphoribosyltransferase
MAENSALFTDLYQLAMAQAYWMAGKANQRAVFTLYFRKNPFRGGYAVMAGTEEVVQYLRDFKFTRDDIDFLMDQIGNDGGPLFNSGFLNYLKNLRLNVEVWGVPEGQVIFPHEPLIRITGSLVHGQLVETALINKVGFATLVATKTARVVRAAGKASVLEFGLRRAQGDAGMVASRSSYIGGAVATSNVLAGKQYGIPVKGTHAHSFVMSFHSELEAFEAYAKSASNNLTFLIDTYETAEGLRNAIKVAKTLPEKIPVAVRLDSGDLLAWSRHCRSVLDAEGLSRVKVIVSNDLDEYSIEKLTAAGAPIDVYGVGTMLATCYDQPALGAVYKLTALYEKDTWQDTVKISEEAAKTSLPGILQTKRLVSSAGRFVGDIIFDEPSGMRMGGKMIVGGFEVDQPKHAQGGNILVPITGLKDADSLKTARQRCKDATSLLPEGVLALSPTENYPVGLDLSLHNNRERALTRLKAKLAATQAA